MVFTNKKKTTQEFAEELLTKRNLVLTTEYNGAGAKVGFTCTNGHPGESTPTNLLSRAYTCKTCKYGRPIFSKRSWTFEDLEKLVSLVDSGSTIHECVVIFKTTEAALRKICEYNGISFKAENKKLITKIEEGLNINGYTANISPYTRIDDIIEVKCHEEHVTNVPVKALLYYGKPCQECRQEDIFSRLVDRLNVQGRTIDPTTYTNINERVDIICSHGHQVSQYAKNVLYNNNGCKVCFDEQGTSKLEKELREFISHQYNGWLVYNDRTILEGKELDIVLPDESLAFEFNGTYWHQQSDKKPPSYHKDKTDKAEANDYQLIHISDYLWANKQDIIKSRIKQLLHTSEKIPARKTIIKQIQFPREFLEFNHLQGAGSPTSTNYALYYKNEIVAVMTFGKPRFTSNQEWELVRFATKQGVSVQGGASKLFKHFVKQNNPKSIVSYAARDFSKGNLYITLGFKHSHNSEPGYAYYDRQLNKISRYQAQKHKLEALLPIYDPKLSENDNMVLNGYYKVYDSGNMVFTWAP